MKPSFPLFLTALVALTAPLPLFGAHDRAYYELIVKSQPFGAMAATPNATSGAVTEEQKAKIQEESSKIQLCAMTYTPDGRIAVGLIDNATSPASCITLFDGETANGLELLFSDLDKEYATFQRDGVTFTLKLGLGLIETITPERYAQLQREQVEAVEAQAEAERKKPNSLAEQLLAMQLSLPPNVEAPPLPIPMGDTHLFTKEFDPNKPKSEPQTESEALIQAGLEEMKASMAAGERPQDYLQRLVEHRQEEVKRQQAEQKAAEESLKTTLASGQHTAEEEAALRRQANIELLKKGVVPLSPVENLTPAEEAEINAALDALP